MSEDTRHGDDLDRGLAEAFGPRNGESVLQVLGALTGESPAIDLSGDSTADKPISIGGDHGTRYEVVEELARGGMGVVLRSKDIDLGREVAMKVIRPEYARQGDVLRRFVEEAQIGGQLEHPGIVPVYELGMQEDQQVYFTMKLIHGTTLSDLLTERATPTAHRRKFLSIFETLCQTIAYAHSRGVIHRDIKPANVMVGAFGEVQVVDWGFAKVLGAADPQGAELTAAEHQVQTIRTREDDGQSKGGAVMGTPAYMPPEQAYGRTEELDRRTDVFALGSTLCEILTGRPAYLSENGNLLVQAAQHEIGDALARLEACTADGELVQLARACLEKQALRPSDAGEVAEAVSDYLTSVEERARAAELAAAEERIKAKEEKRRRRLTVALAATALLVVLVGGGAYGWSEKARLDRVRTHTIAVAGDIREATGLEAEARTSGHVPKWEQAVLAARKAVSRAETDEVDAEVLSDAHAVLARVEQGHAEAVAMETRVARDDAMAALLREIRERLGHARNYAQMDADYGEAFRDYGIDVEALDAERAVELMQSSAIAHELVGALDSWAHGVRRQGTDDRAREGRLLALAAAADEDPWRAAVRKASAERDGDGLRRLAADANPAELDAVSALLMAEALAVAFSPSALIEFLRDAQPFHPDDFWINQQLGVNLNIEGDEYALEAQAYLRAALAVRPESSETLHFLGLALMRAGDHEAAIAAWRRGLGARPDYHHLHVHILDSLKRTGRFEETRQELVARLREHPEDAIANWKMGYILATRRQYSPAAKWMEEAVRLDSDLAMAWFGLGRIYRFLDRNEDALKAFGEAARIEPYKGSPLLMQGEVYEDMGEAEKALEVYRKALELYPAFPKFRMALAKALARAGRGDEAMVHYRKMMSLHQGTRYVPQSRSALAGALAIEGYAKEAREVAVDAVEACRERLREDENHIPTLVRLGGLLCDSLWEFEEAIAVFKRVVALRPNAHAALWGIHVSHHKLGDPAGGAEALQTYVRYWPKRLDAQTRLGWYLTELDRWDEATTHFEKGAFDMHGRRALYTCYLRAGRYEEAMVQFEALRTSIPFEKQGWSYPKEAWSRAGETFVDLAKRRADLVAGKDALETPEEMVLFGLLLADRHAGPAALPYFRRALAADPKLAAAHAPNIFPYRWGAVAGMTAVESGTGLGPLAKTLDEPTRKALREEGRAFMRKELEHFEALLDADPEEAGNFVAASLRSWWTTLCRVRYGRVFGALSPAEQESWNSFWTDVDRLIRRARGNE